MDSLSTSLISAFQIGGWPLVAIIISVFVPVMAYRFQAPKNVKKSDEGNIYERMHDLENALRAIEVTNAECVKVAISIERRVEDIWGKINAGK